MWGLGFIFLSLYLMEISASEGLCCVDPMSCFSGQESVGPSLDNYHQICFLMGCKIEIIKV